MTPPDDRDSSHLQVKWLVVALLALSATGCELCTNVIVETLPSPNGELDAVLYQRDCGATTGFSTQVSVVPEGEEVVNGNVLSADCDGGSAPAASWGGPPAEIKWLGDRRLLVRYHAKSRLFKAEKEVRISVGSGSGRRTTVAVEIEAVPDLREADARAN
jgi:hypothetical protein